MIAVDYINRARGKVYLFLLSPISAEDFLKIKNIDILKKNGTTIDLRNFIFMEPGNAITQVLTGCNPGSVGFLDIASDCLKFKKSEGFNKTVLSLLTERGFSVEVSINKIPEGHADFSFIYLSDLQLIDEILDRAMKDECYIFLIPPVFEEYVEKAVNINNFLREKEIIEINSEGQIVWENSLAYQKEYGQIWINLIGREPQGAVSPGEEYNEVRDALIKGITNKLTDDQNGEAVIERVYKKEELFEGTFISQMPDLIVSLRQGYGFSHAENEPCFDVSAVCKRKTKAYTVGSGAIAGEKIKQDCEGKDVAITSIVPSILYCMGSPIPSWMDGKVEEQIFTENSLSEASPKYEHDEDSPALSEQDEDLIKDRLKELGYL